MAVLLSDDFVGSTLDTTKWIPVSSGITVSGGSLHLPYLDTDNPSLIRSFNVYPLIGASYTLKTSAFPFAGVAGMDFFQGFFGIGGGPATLRWEIRYLPSAGDTAMIAYPSFLTPDSGGTVFRTDLAIPLSATIHRWLRIRETPGTMFWECSADGVSWTLVLAATEAPTFAPFAASLGNTSRVEMDLHSGLAAGPTWSWDIDSVDISAPLPLSVDFLGINQTVAPGGGGGGPGGVTPLVPVAAISRVGVLTAASIISETIPSPTYYRVTRYRNVQCARWIAVLTDPQLRPLARLRIRSAQLGWLVNATGQASLNFEADCELRFQLGWHHVAFYRSDYPHCPLWAGRILSFSQDKGTLAAEDLSAWLTQRTAQETGVVAATPADPVLWIQRILTDANRQGVLPIVPVPYGGGAAIQMKPTATVGNPLFGLLADLQRFGIAWTMTGPYLRFGVGNTAPPGMVLTQKQFHRLSFDVASNVVTQVITQGANGQIGVYPPPPTVLANSPRGVVTVSATELSSVPALDKLAKIHYDQLAGPTVKLASQQLARNAQVRVKDLVPGRRFVVSGGRYTVTGQIQATNAAITGRGFEQAVTIDMQRADDSMLKRV